MTPAAPLAPGREEASGGAPSGTKATSDPPAPARRDPTGPVLAAPAGPSAPAAAARESAVPELGAAQPAAAQVADEVTRRALAQGQATPCPERLSEGEGPPPAAAPGDVSGQQAIGTAARGRAADREAAERTAADLQVLTASSLQFVRRVLVWQQACCDLAQRTLPRFGNTSRALLWATSPIACAQVQRALYVDAVSGALTSGPLLLQLARRIAQDTWCPLQERARTRD